MTEAISGGIARCTNGRKRVLLEMLEDIMNERGKAKPIEGRWTKRKRCERAMRARGEELSCLPSHEELREQKRRDRKSKAGLLTTKQKKAARR